MRKACTKCLVVQPLENFYKQHGRNERPMSTCKTCSYARNKELRSKIPNRVRLYNRKSHLKNTFGISIEEFDRLYKLQDGKCAICEEKGGGNEISDLPALHVDHLHSGNEEIRSLLCQRCNQAIGLMRENPLYLRLAAEYVSRHQFRNSRQSCLRTNAA